MFVSINPVKKLQRDLADEIDVRDPAPPSAPPKTTISALLRGIGSSIDADPPPAPLPTQRHEEWSSLIDRIRESARYVRDVEAEARSRDVQMDELLRRVSTDLAEADARVRAAEARIAEVEARAAERVHAAEARAEIAEQRARDSDEWLARVQEIIHTEFSGAKGTTG